MFSLFKIRNVSMWGGQSTIYWKEDVINWLAGWCNSDLTIKFKHFKLWKLNVMRQQFTLVLKYEQKFYCETILIINGLNYYIMTFINSVLMEALNYYCTIQLSIGCVFSPINSWLTISHGNIADNKWRKYMDTVVLYSYCLFMYFTKKLAETCIRIIN